MVAMTSEETKYLQGSPARKEGERIDHCGVLWLFLACFGCVRRGCHGALGGLSFCSVRTGRAI
eukprot:COSAG02_NODE_6722_length_3401_cov_4.311932_2_plen_63_part_00